MAEQQTTAMVGHEAPAGSGEPSFLGLNPGGWIALAVLFVLAILVWKKVPKAIGSALDIKIATIRAQLAEAESLRNEAEALKAEYVAKAASADQDREALLERARRDAEEIVAKAKTDAETLIDRRTRMAEDKIAAEERTAIKQLRSAAAEAAAKAAARLIAERHDGPSDAKLVDQAIAQIAGQ
jgi:F-type H+-transporting ATPase subunit b